MSPKRNLKKVGSQQGPIGPKRLLKWGAGALGLDWNAYQALSGCVVERLQRRMSDLGCRDAEDYRRILLGASGDGDADELRVLQQSVLQIDISRFFRTGTLWQYLLASVLPEMLRTAVARQRPCRCWCLGAGLGEEIYSLKACWELGLNHIDTHGAARPGLEIVVSEISQESLDFARIGEYVVQHGNLDKCKQKTWASWHSGGAETFREVPTDWRSSMFVQLSSGNLRVAKRLRKGISWRCESWSEALDSGDPAGWLSDVGGPFHLIFGRHGPFFYPDMPSQRALLGFCAQALDPQGYLVIGRDESRRFAKHIVDAAPMLVNIPRPSCGCRTNGDCDPLPPPLFKARRKRALAASRAPAGCPPACQGGAAEAARCGLCAAAVGEPGKMVWRKA